MSLVAGVDSSTQSCKVVICDADTGRVVREGAAPHPPGTEVDPELWWQALLKALDRAGGLEGVDAISVAAQQHGLVCLDANGHVIRPALLWNDTRSAPAAADLIAELGDGDAAAGSQRWASAVGSVPVASFTITKLRWLVDHEPDLAARIASLALPHDWLTWRLSGAASLDTLVTDRSDASGTGYFDPTTNRYRQDLLALALRTDEATVEKIALPRVLAPSEAVGRVAATPYSDKPLLGPGCGDNAGAALGLQLHPGETYLSLGTSGVVAALADHGTSDPTGAVTGFADATGRFLPLACTLNGSRVLDAIACVLGVDHERLSDLALAAPLGANGLVHLPYLEGERTPNLPTATGSLHGLTLTTMSPANLARAAVEGLLCLLAGAVEAVRRQGVRIEQVTLVGGGARSQAVRKIGPAVLGVPVKVPKPGEYVAIGAARQAAWVRAGTAAPPAWQIAGSTTYRAEPAPDVLRRYRNLQPTPAAHPSG